MQTLIAHGNAVDEILRTLISGQRRWNTSVKSDADLGRLSAEEVRAKLLLASPTAHVTKPPPDTPLLIGTAGWTLPRDEAAAFPGEGTHLQRYAARLTAAEINSSFYRPHRASTYERWASSVPNGFRFSVKMPKEITHSARLKEVEELLDSFLRGVQGLGKTLGCLLIQLPPSLAFESAVASRFLTALRDRYPGGLLCEPRHASWLQPDAEAMLTEFRVARVAADPDRPPGAGMPGGWSDIRYFRLHGSPRMYYSCYSRTELMRVSEQLTQAQAEGSTVWCIFDNTVLGAATRNARELMHLVAEQWEAGS